MAPPSTVSRGVGSSTSRCLVMGVGRRACQQGWTFLRRDWVGLDTLPLSGQDEIALGRRVSRHCHQLPRPLSRTVMPSSPLLRPLPPHGASHAPLSSALLLLLLLLLHHCRLQPCWLPLAQPGRRAVAFSQTSKTFSLSRAQVLSQNSTSVFSSVFYFILLAKRSESACGVSSVNTASVVDAKGALASCSYFGGRVPRRILWPRRSTNPSSRACRTCEQ